MRRSIRHQILIPLVAVQVATVATTALVAAWLAAGRVEGDVARQLDGVVETLGRSNFPLTAGVLAKMRGLSGAHFVACSADGRVLESTLPGLAELPPALRSLPSRARLDPPGRSPKLDLGGSGYFAASVHSPGGPGRPTLLVLYPEAAWRRARVEAALPPLAVGLASLAPMAGVTGLVAHRLGVRLRALQARVAAIAAGEFGPADDPGRRDEIHDLVDSVNRMGVQLGEMRGAIRRTERAGVLARLAAGLAHQLRNAATGARMAVQLHARRCPGGDADRSLEVALRQLALCEEQVKGLLAAGSDAARPPTPIDVAGLVGEVAALVEPACRHAGVAFAHRCGPGLAAAGDAEGLRSALLNLALNAIEASGAGDAVSLEAWAEPGAVRFEGGDDGPGPPPGPADAIFEPFVTAKPDGVGLGLAPARRVAAEHGGEVGWTRQGGLTRFRLILPEARDRAGVAT